MDGNLTIHIKRDHQFWPALAGLAAGFIIGVFCLISAWGEVQKDQIDQGGFFRDGVRYSVQVAR